MMKDWTESQRERQAAVLAGRSVVANVRKGADEMLVAWAKSEGRVCLIVPIVDFQGTNAVASSIAVYW
jgi:hypothetical protein